MGEKIAGGRLWTKGMEWRRTIGVELGVELRMIRLEPVFAFLYCAAKFTILCEGVRRCGFVIVALEQPYLLPAVMCILVTMSVRGSVMVGLSVSYRRSIRASLARRPGRHCLRLPPCERG